MNVILKTQEDVKSLSKALVHQVLDLENYDLVVNCEIHFDEIEPGDEGYVVGTMKFMPWGADAFDTMENIIRATVQPEFMSMIVRVDNMAGDLEDRLREHFNCTFNTLVDQDRCAGTFYVGDNGEFIARYLDTTEVENETIIKAWEEKFGQQTILPTAEPGCLDISIM